MPHIHEKYDFTVSAWIVYDSRILLLVHKKLGLWLPPGGHVELDEDPEQALWHEIEEETGLEKNRLKLAPVCQNRFASTPGYKQLLLPYDISVHKFKGTEHRHIDLSYLLVSDTDRVQPAEGEAQQLKWFSVTQLRTVNDLALDVRNKAIAAIEEVQKWQNAKK